MPPHKTLQIGLLRCPDATLRTSPDTESEPFISASINQFPGVTVDDICIICRTVLLGAHPRQRDDPQGTFLDCITSGHNVPLQKGESDERDELNEELELEDLGRNERITGSTEYQQSAEVMMLHYRVYDPLDEIAAYDEKSLMKYLTLRGYVEPKGPEKKSRGKKGKQEKGKEREGGKETEREKRVPLDTTTKKKRTRDSKLRGEVRQRDGFCTVSGNRGGERLGGLLHVIHLLPWEMGDPYARSVLSAAKLNGLVHRAVTLQPEGSKCDGIDSKKNASLVEASLHGPFDADQWCFFVHGSKKFLCILDRSLRHFELELCESETRGDTEFTQSCKTTINCAAEKMKKNWLHADLSPDEAIIERGESNSWRNSFDPAEPNMPYEDNDRPLLLFIQWRNAFSFYRNLTAGDYRQMREQGFDPDTLPDLWDDDDGDDDDDSDSNDNDSDSDNGGSPPRSEPGPNDGNELDDDEEADDEEDDENEEEDDDDDENENEEEEDDENEDEDEEDENDENEEEDDDDEDDDDNSEHGDNQEQDDEFHEYNDDNDRIQSRETHDETASPESHSTQYARNPSKEIRMEETTKVRTTRVRQDWNKPTNSRRVERERDLLVCSARYLSTLRAQAWVNLVAKCGFSGDISSAIEWCRTNLEKMPKGLKRMKEKQVRSHFPQRQGRYPLAATSSNKRMQSPANTSISPLPMSPVTNRTNPPSPGTSSRMSEEPTISSTHSPHSPPWSVASSDRMSISSAGAPPPQGKTASFSPMPLDPRFPTPPRSGQPPAPRAENPNRGVPPGSVTALHQVMGFTPSHTTPQPRRPEYQESPRARTEREERAPPSPTSSPPKGGNKKNQHGGGRQ